MSFKRKILRFMPDGIYLKLLYKHKTGKKLNLKNPQTFNEKLQWLKLHDRNPLYTTMVDKYEAKKYVANIIGEEYIIPTLGIWNNFDDIDFDKLPEQFVLKCTHDSGGLVICKDKSKLDVDAARKKINRCIKNNYYYHSREWPYKNVKPRIIAEEYLENNEKGLYDYKVWCFNGRATYIQFISGRISNIVYEGFYDRNWALNDFTFHNEKILEVTQKPRKLNDLLRLSEILSNGVSFARVDFYILPDDSIRFGEITFYPMSGFEHFKPESTDLMLGNLIQLPNTRH